MKKKIMAIFLCVALVAIAVVGASLAYFTDTDSAENTFTVGNVKIAIREVFDPDDAVLVPGKDINKDVFVKNDGSQDAYVRVHIAIPADMDDGDPSFDASHNFLHFNFTKESLVAGQWSWLSTMTDGEGYNAKDWNFYTATINDVLYNVYVVTYRTALEPGAETKTQSLDKVYLDRTVDCNQNEDGTITYKDTKGNKVTLAKDAEVKVLVFAEGCQAEGFSDAYTALNTSLGTPGSTGYVAPWNK